MQEELPKATLNTPDREQLPRKQIAAMVAAFKRRNPSFVDDVRPKHSASPPGQGEQLSDRTSER
jgi:hypothetical protein